LDDGVVVEGVVGIHRVVFPAVGILDLVLDGGGVEVRVHGALAVADHEGGVPGGIGELGVLELAEGDDAGLAPGHIIEGAGGGESVVRLGERRRWIESGEQLGIGRLEEVGMAVKSRTIPTAGEGKVDPVAVVNEAAADIGG